MPPDITLVPLPFYAPQFNPVERVWLFLRERFLSHHPLKDYDAVVAACRAAWRALTPGCLRSLYAYPQIAEIASSARRHQP